MVWLFQHYLIGNDIHLFIQSYADNNSPVGRVGQFFDKHIIFIFTFPDKRICPEAIQRGSERFEIFPREGFVPGIGGNKNDPLIQIKEGMDFIPNAT